MRSPEPESLTRGTAPIAKVANAGWAGSAATVAIFICKQLGLDLPPEVAAAIVTLAAYSAAYLTALKPREIKSSALAYTPLPQEQK